MSTRGSLGWHGAAGTLLPPPELLQCPSPSSLLGRRCCLCSRGSSPAGRLHVDPSPSLSCPGCPSGSCPPSPRGSILGKAGLEFPRDPHHQGGIRAPPWERRRETLEPVFFFCCLKYFIATSRGSLALPAAGLVRVNTKPVYS